MFKKVVFCLFLGDLILTINYACSINNTDLERVSEKKGLGVTFDSKQQKAYGFLVRNTKEFKNKVAIIRQY